MDTDFLKKYNKNDLFDLTLKILKSFFTYNIIITTNNNLITHD